ncbi:hypothetical protein BKA70DRAFT_842190 [Coprinopsis sp. MPI-PUGE-AT-0042]|nr:hypothetical protein BKA70DRAFT_842190 [Coprinopsis sp. MPI-PUGE-AT-0042]
MTILSLISSICEAMPIPAVVLTAHSCIAHVLVSAPTLGLACMVSNRTCWISSILHLPVALATVVVEAPGRRNHSACLEVRRSVHNELRLVNGSLDESEDCVARSRDGGDWTITASSHTDQRVLDGG